MQQQDAERIMNCLRRLALQAGAAIMEVYVRADIAVQHKADASPLTEADEAADRLISAGLQAEFPDIAVVTEEQAQSHNLQAERFFIVDPLDGTKEFVKKNGEFTVNVALIEAGRPVFGVVHAPALDVTYWGQAGQGAWKQTGGADPEPIAVAPVPQGSSGWRVVGSRSHQSEAFQVFLERLPEAEIVAMGSSLKLCLVAEGAADLYPRLGLTSEWDTGAAQAVVEAAGGQVLEYPSLQPLRYNTRPETLLNPHFIVCARPSEVWAAGTSAS